MIKALKRAHPFVVFTYFAGMFLLAPFSRHPWMTGVADDLFMSAVFLS